MAVDVTVPNSGTLMLDIFKEAQLNTLCHDRLCLQLRNLYSNSRFTYFADDFFELCRYSLVNSDRIPCRERTVDFICKFVLFCGKSDEDDTQDTLHNRLLLKTFLFCIKYNECSNPAVRFRCMQIVHKLLEGIGDNGVMPDALYANLQTILLRRVQDTKASVRVQAVQALSRMQDPTDLNCPAVEAFLWLARHDPTSEVRRAALAAMVPTTRTLPVLIERCRDVADSVRSTAYRIIASRGILRPLSIAKRIRVIQDGLTDRSAEVKQAAHDVVLSWFKATKNNPIQLLRRLDTEGVPETSQLLLDNLFKILPVNEFNDMVTDWSINYLTPERTLKPDSLIAEVAFFWRSLAEYMRRLQSNSTTSTTNPLCPSACPTSLCSNEQQRMDDEEINGEDQDQPNSPTLDSILPSVSAYVDLAKGLVDQLVSTILAGEFDEKIMEQECVVEHVLRLSASLDLSDEFGRRRLSTLVRQWITSAEVPNTLSPHLLKLHAFLEPQLRKRINNVIEMISELCDPVEPPNLQPSAQITQPNTDDLATPASSNHQQSLSTEPVKSSNACPNSAVAPTLTKEQERSLRLNVASIEVKLNELNESLHQSVARQDFEKATGLRDACAKLEAERADLLQKLHGQIRTEPSTDRARADDSDQTVTIAPLNGTKNDDDEADNVGDEEEEPQSLLDRCKPSVLLKANRLAALVIQQCPTLWRLPASLRSLLSSLVFPSIQHADPGVRNQAILTLGLCCTMDLPLTLQYIPLLYSAMNVDHPMISETALRCIIDCLLVFGLRPFHEAKAKPNMRIPPTIDEAVAMESKETGVEDEDEDESLSSSDFVVLIRRSAQDKSSGNESFLVAREDMSITAARFLNPIVALLDSEDDDLRTTSAIGLAKLLIYDRFVSSHVLSLLMLLWFNPVSEDRPIIRRGLACFFTDYACGNTTSDMGNQRSDSTRYHQSALADAVLPTLTALIRAPASSPLSEIDPTDVAALFARLTDTSHLHSVQQPNRVKQQTGTESGDEANINKEDNNVADDLTANNHNNPHHDHLARLLAVEVLKAPQSAEAKLYLRLLCELRPSKDNVQIFTELLLLSDSVVKFIDRSSALLIHRFRKQVNESLERLGLDPEQVLAEARRKQDVSPEVDKSASMDSVLGRSQSVVRLSCSRPGYPTLLGSARANTHLLGNNDPPDANVTVMHNTTILHQANRTHVPGLSILDKSGRLLAFSDDDDDSCDEVVRHSTSTEPVNILPQAVNHESDTDQSGQSADDVENVSSENRKVLRQSTRSRFSKSETDNNSSATAVTPKRTVTRVRVALRTRERYNSTASMTSSGSSKTRSPRPKRNSLSTPSSASSQSISGTVTNVPKTMPRRNTRRNR